MAASATILHVAERAQWDAAGADYAPTAFAAEGFIHCCSTEQLAAVCARHYRTRDDLLLLTLAVAQLAPAPRYEVSPSAGEAFPHLYARLDRTAVVATRPLTVDADGVPHF